MTRCLALFGKPRYLGILVLPEDRKPERGEILLVQSPRGEELAVLVGAVTPEKEKSLRAMRVHQDPSEGGKGSEPAVFDLQFLSVASEEDRQRMEELRGEEDAILARGREILKGHPLPMKLIDVEYLVDRKKLFFYFTSEQRVDFRAFVRDLAKEHRTRIELRQVGVRDEAKIIRGLSPCGRPCCCSYWLQQFAPICIRMVKEQNLALNPTKISGICGRLMCCMGYEHPVYRELWSGLPNPGSKIKAPQGTYILQGVDLRSRSVRCSGPMGGDRTVPVDRFAEFREAVLAGKDWEAEPRGAEASRGAGEPRPDRQEGRRRDRDEEGRRRFDRPGGPRPRKDGPPEASRPAPEPEHPAGAAPVEGEPGAPAKKRRNRKRKRPAGTREGAPSPETPAPAPKETKPPKPKPPRPPQGGEGAPKGDGGSPQTPGASGEDKKPRKRRRRSRGGKPKEGASEGASAPNPGSGNPGGDAA